MASVDQMVTALRRAAHVIQGAYGALTNGISGEAIIALATANQRGDESWTEACARAQKQLEADWPNCVKK